LAISKFSSFFSFQVKGTLQTKRKDRKRKIRQTHIMPPLLTYMHAHCMRIKIKLPKKRRETESNNEIILAGEGKEKAIHQN
jgi:hypothetical protein